MPKFTYPIIDLLDPEFIRNPYTFYNFLRESQPLAQIKNGTYVLSRYDDVKFALKRYDIFSSGWSDAPLIHPDWLDAEAQRGSFMAEKDPPEHTQHRAIVHKAFIEKSIKALIPEMNGSAQRLLSRIKPNEHFDFLSVFAYPYVTELSDTITGLGLSKTGKTRYWAEIVESFPIECPVGQARASLKKVIDEQNAYYDSLIRARQEVPREDLITRLAQAKVDGQALTKAQIRGALNLFTLGGFQAPGQMLANAAIVLANEPELANFARQSFENLCAFIEELLRLHNPSQGSIRITRSEVTLSGGTIPANSNVIVLIGSANRDPRQFENPDEFIPFRGNIKSHLGFGQGPHVCIGEALARWQLRVAIGYLLESFDTIECEPFEKQRWESNMLGRMLRNLPIRLIKSSSL